MKFCIPGHFPLEIRIVFALAEVCDGPIEYLSGGTHQTIQNLKRALNRGILLAVMSEPPFNARQRTGKCRDKTETRFIKPQDVSRSCDVFINRTHVELIS